MKSRNLNRILSMQFLCFACLIPVGVSAEVIPGTSLSVHFESGNVVGSGRNINMHRVPVINVETGQTTLYNVVFRFTFNPADGFVFEQISSVAVSQPVSVANITPGLYKDQTDLCYLLEGPSLLDDNRSLYTIRGVDNTASAACRSNTPDYFTAQIISGSATGHPDIGNREIVPSLADTYVYGVVADDARFNGVPINQNWRQNSLIGARQSGEQLILGLFSDGVDDFKDSLENAILTKVIE
ncbi:hypothetical protein SAMN05216326_11067 [Nitrosomonas marina]|uniref:Uncharacterized protein n=1 Tax=Nitrosomonas marina TaxID=917 RepID=A0A1I0BEZ6_9PROT|nr:hypothetical protein [Nitrosomonas marina]SET05082.1 hypothetical protein SAMN05216326_11067 [Nitrosomonas marina]